MRHLPSPRRGQPIRAHDVAEHIRATEAALHWTIDGADLTQTAEGQHLTVQRHHAIELVQIVSDWTHVPPGEDSETRPTGWHYCEAVILQRGRTGNRGWAPTVPPRNIHLWAPAAYPGSERMSMRGLLGDALLPPRYRPGDWVWAIYHQSSGLWCLLDGYGELVSGTVVSDAWYACTEARVALIDDYSGKETSTEVDAVDLYGVIAAHARAPTDLESGGQPYLPKDTVVLLRYMPGPGLWVLVGARLCAEVPESSGPPPSVSSGGPSHSGVSSYSYQPPSEPPRSSSGASKSTAIVPVSWSPTGFTALFVLESPEVRFDDVLTVVTPAVDTVIPIDERFVSVCEPNSIEVCGVAVDVPLAVGARVHGDSIHLRFATQCPDLRARVVVRLSGIRRGYAGVRFPPRTRAQFEANERFIRSAYGDAD